MDLAAMLEHASEFNFLIEIALILAVASFGGWLAKLIQMPPVLGQMLVGILIGPSVLNIIHGEDELIHVISQIGVIFLMFLAGLETDLKELKSSGKGAASIALGGIVLPLVFGTIVPLWFFKQYLPVGDDKHQFLFALYIGTILTATSVSIAVSVLRDMNQLSSKQGISILGGAIIDDVLGIILLAVISAMVTPKTGTSSIFILILDMALFFLLLLIFGFVISKAINRFAQGAVWRDRIITLAIIICFLFAFGAEMFSIAAITGAYAAGVVFATTPYRHRIVERVESFAYTLFTPIFFVSMGLSVYITSDIMNYMGYALALLVVAILGKFIGCSLAAKFSRFSWRHSFQVGVGMIARAEVGLIVANQGFRSGVISTETFTSVVLLVIVSTVLTPPLLKLLFKGEKVSTLI